MMLPTPAGPPVALPDAPGSSRPSPTCPSPVAPVPAPLPSVAVEPEPSGTVVGFFGQPASASVAIAIKRTGNGRITRTPCSSVTMRFARGSSNTARRPAPRPSIDEWGPGCLAQLARARRDALLDAPVARHDRECVLPADAARVQDVGS